MTARGGGKLVGPAAIDAYLKSLIIEVHKHHGGRALDVEKDSQSALQEYREILKINPSDFDAHYQIAVTHMEEKNYEEAVKELSDLRDRFPNNIEVLNLLGWALINSGKVEPSFRTWQQSLRLDPKNAETRNNIVQARLALGKKWKSAMGEFEVVAFDQDVAEDRQGGLLGAESLEQSPGGLERVGRDFDHDDVGGLV